MLSVGNKQYNPSFKVHGTLWTEEHNYFSDCTAYPYELLISATVNFISDDSLFPGRAGTFQRMFWTMLADFYIVYFSLFIFLLLQVK